MIRYCLCLDLKNEEELIQAYEAYHKKVWPEILKSIQAAGILQMEIYRFSNRLCMIMETMDNFQFEDKAKADASNEKVQQWEALMWKYQSALPGCKPGEKWVLMNKIFDLKTSL